MVEEYVRFVLDDAHLTQLQKQLRHDLAAILGELPRECLLTARSTQHDVGTAVTTSSEFARRDVRDVAEANQKRVEQSLRSLEEFLKPVAPATAGRIEQLRYRTYSLGRAVALTDHSRQRLAGASLYVLIDGHTSLETFAATVEALIGAGVDIVQLRAPQLTDRQLVARARLLRDRTRHAEMLYVMNNRPDLAVLTQADGVHVGQDDLTVKEIRAIVGTEMLVGVSTHSLEQARQAVIDGANYLGCGPTFPSRTKSFTQFPGLDLLAAVRQEISLPAFAIGGIDLENLASVRATGFTRVAVASAVTSAADPAAAARQFVTALR